jgi:hypothetical protein
VYYNRDEWMLRHDSVQHRRLFGTFHLGMSLHRSTELVEMSFLKFQSDLLPQFSGCFERMQGYVIIIEVVCRQAFASSNKPPLPNIDCSWRSNRLSGPDLLPPVQSTFVPNSNPVRLSAQIIELSLPVTEHPAFVMGPKTMLN